MTNNTLRRLVVRVGQGSLMFSTTGEGNQVDFEQYPVNGSITMAANLREALRTSSLLVESYQRTLVMVDAPVLMVPADIFDEKEKEQLYFHAFTRKEQQAVKHTVLPDLNCVALFSIGKDLLTVIKDRLPHPTVIAAMAPVWRHMHQRSYTGIHQKMYGYCHDHRLEVFSFGKNRFKFCNTYAVNSSSNALYYLLAAWKQLGLAPDHDELHLAGELPDAEALMEKAKEFVKRVFYINPTGEFNRAPVTQVEGMPYDMMTLYVKGR